MKYKAISEHHLYSKAFAKGDKCGAHTVAVYVLRDYRAAALAKANPMKKKINRIGLSVSKKLGGAVTRSRVKRILREGYRLTDMTVGVKKGFLIVLVAKEKSVTAKTADIVKDMKYAFGKIRMLCGDEPQSISKKQ